MEYYYQYEYIHSSLKEILVWDYSKEIIETLREHYEEDLIEVNITKSHYGFWIKREKETYEQTSIGKKVANKIPAYTQSKKKYTYTKADGTTGESTHVFIENKEKRLTR